MDVSKVPHVLLMSLKRQLCFWVGAKYLQLCVAQDRQRKIVRPDA